MIVWRLPSARAVRWKMIELPSGDQAAEPTVEASSSRASVPDPCSRRSNRSMPPYRVISRRFASGDHG
jgi:hypothetical protein